MPTRQIEERDKIAINIAREELENGRELPIAIDTNIFLDDYEGDRVVNLYQPWIKRLRKLSASGQQVLTTSIWKIELERLLAKSNVKQLQRLTLPHTRGKNIKDQELATILKSARSHKRAALASTIENAKSEIAKLFEDLHAIFVEHDTGSLPELVSRWSNIDPPFSIDKTLEFPDAIALMGLRRYANEHGRILVITDDREAAMFCEKHDSLIALSNIESALELLEQRQELVNMRNLSIALSDAKFDYQNLLTGLRNAISQEIRQQAVRDILNVSLARLGPSQTLFRVTNICENKITIEGIVEYDVALHGTPCDPTVAHGTTNTYTTSTKRLSGPFCAEGTKFGDGEPHSWNWFIWGAPIPEPYS